MKVAMIFNDVPRPETTGFYCLRALDSICDVVHVRPRDAKSITRRDFDLFVRIDDGLHDRIPIDLKPSVWWAIDTHCNFDRCLEIARDFDLVFAAQRDGAERLLDKGILSASWLPLACDPKVHRKHECTKIHDIAFVGNIFAGPRSDMIDMMRRKFSDMIVTRAYFDEMAMIYSSARVVFNRSVLNDVNMRVFEALSCGSLLLTNDLSLNGQDSMFRDGVHLATYLDHEELIDKASFYLSHDSAREKIAAAGRAEVLSKHTYDHRMTTIMDRAKNIRDNKLYQNLFKSYQKNKDPGYFEHARSELLEFIPRSARRVLDVGCGSGMLGAALKSRQNAYVVGIERDERAVETARSRIDEVIGGDVEVIEINFDRNSFDAIVCGDVLEHLLDPEGLLIRAREWLRDDGTIVASIPNARHHSVITALLAGNWTYEHAGLMDETHLCFFTRRDMIDLFSRGGFRVDRIAMVPGPGYKEWSDAGMPGQVRVGRLNVVGVDPMEAEEFFVYQYLIAAKLTMHEHNLRQTDHNIN